MLNINKEKLCSNCFKPIKSEPCCYCGYKKTTGRVDAGVLPVGTILKERYSIGGVLGKGGFGITYKAYDIKDLRIVAVKEYYPGGIIYRERGTSEVHVSSRQYEENFKAGADKFFEEAKTVSRFNGNPSIVSVYEFFYENGTVYFAMEYLDGIDLKHYLQMSGGRLSQEKVVFIANVISDALLIAHSMNVLHRDISPDNIFVLKDGTVKLIDFGAARQVIAEQSKSLSVILKQGFAPLEQYQRRGKQGPWTDIYAFGATLYYLLTGKLPDEVTERIDFPDIGKAQDYGVSPDLWEIIRKCMEVKIADRYQSIFEIKEKLGMLDIVPEPLCINSDKITDEITKTVSLETAAVSETIALSKEETEKNINKKNNLFLNFFGSLKGKIIAGASVAVITLGMLILIIVISKSGNKRIKDAGNVPAVGESVVKENEFKETSNEKGDDILESDGQSGEDTIGESAETPQPTTLPPETPQPTTLPPETTPPAVTAETVTNQPYTAYVNDPLMGGGDKYGLYSGEWKDGKPEGIGTFTYSVSIEESKIEAHFGSEYSHVQLGGTWSNGQLNGYGYCASTTDSNADMDFTTGVWSSYNEVEISIGNFTNGESGYGDCDHYYLEQWGTFGGGASGRTTVMYCMLREGGQKDWDGILSLP